MIIYHNSRCKKSREALNFLINKKIDVQVIEYLKNGLTVNAPAFIKEGDIVKINTETLEYLERVKK